MDNYYQNPSQGFAPENQVPTNLTPYTLQRIKETATWMRVVSVILFILTALIFLAAIGVLAAGSGLRSFGGRSGFSSAVAILYILLGVIFYLIPGILLIAHSTRLKNFSITNNLTDFEDAIAKGKSYWTYIGVLALIITILMFIAVVITIAAAVK